MIGHSLMVTEPRRRLFWWSCEAVAWDSGYDALVRVPPLARRRFRALHPDDATAKAWDWLHTGSPL